MFTVYHSNQVETLKILLVHLIKNEPLDDPFIPESILVQSPGMSQWLKMALASELGVAANLEFPLPATFIWQMFTQVLPDVPQRSAFNKEAMSWRLMELLPKLLDREEFQPLQRYLQDDEDDSKRFQLAEKIADIFDGYLVYRPDWILSWEAGEDVAEIADQHPWQPILWRELYAYTREQGHSIYHRANLYQRFIEQLASGDFDRSTWPKRLFIFGISALPPRYIDALRAMGEHIDVHLMLTNPCQHYWGDIRDRKYLARVAAQKRKLLHINGEQVTIGSEVSPLKGDVENYLQESMHLSHAVGNSLLASMGKMGRDNLYLLAQNDQSELELFIEIQRDSLLHHIQADILHLQEHQDDAKFASSGHKPCIAEQDDSLQIALCHSPIREVEVLHDRLLAEFERDSSLKPRDVIVMVPDINAYAPYIQAVFGNAPGERFIAFSISDRSADQESPILTAFLQLLALPQSRCLASELLELLETPAIMARFAIDEEEFATAKRWVEEAGIRWGLNSDTGAEFELPASEQNTWQFGIERMLLGYAMPAEAGLYELGGQWLAPYNQVQGMSAELAGKLAHFVQTLSELRSQLAQTQSMEQWRYWLNELLERCFSVDLQGELALKTIRDSLVNLKQQLADAGYQQAISSAIIRQVLTNKLSGTRISQRFLAGQVNFCTLMPMRSIPFRRVCLLGMNDGVYPPNEMVEGFDLRNVQRRVGDRSRREESRYLFLEALLSAKEQLYISYVGRSIQDNSERVPSVLVSELLEYCEQNYCLAGDENLESDDSGRRLVEHLTTQYPMVPFSPQAFIAGSFAREWLPAARRQGQSSADFLTPLSDYLLEVSWPMELDLVELQRFWRLPVEYFFKRRLKVSFEPPLAVLEDDEPFALDGLSAYQLRDELVENLLACRDGAERDQVVAQFAKQQRAQGKLPVAAFGDLELAQSAQQALALAEKIGFLCHQPLDDEEIDLRLQPFDDGREVLLRGWLVKRYLSGLVRARSGAIRSEDLLAAWIDHLCLAASGKAVTTHLIGYERKEGVQHQMLPPLNDAQQAKTLLSELVALFCQGMNQPLAYFPKTALACVEAGFSRGKWQEDEEKSYKKMADTFNDSFYIKGEGGNRYIARIWPQWSDELAKTLRQLAIKVLQTPRLQVQDAEQA
ncbi:exodeoxyribonuclease V subunit gamma [Vibrio cholerae]|uniref:exodeoxyribonuclease V subunit gamma n=1 Tax=Vibrio cholerae TaxID=666 RepID=UPI000E0B67E8|nr:exodeoxyribonuclease V subunit gamma [Vibrio cholerae]EGQ9834595.1 exodeoxyribonuclease V subunit gamma [Vibrio cholerae]EJL6467916.1 exodeoxyribonuclease V subunit gamma [Vibrio cholerae]EJL6714448.1 exodeoxyribonuclease V subunit gamma [Vibrio cholerae]EJL6717728.1 exodeoxyribonuclease V subunit gamma [Vibrio cholerae]EKF9632510.1 exodeoxyribonuclease V subunit gamma [Vibrio cholerae]